MHLWDYFYRLNDDDDDDGDDEWEVEFKITSSAGWSWACAAGEMELGRTSTKDSRTRSGIGNALKDVDALYAVCLTDVAGCCCCAGDNGVIWRWTRRQASTFWTSDEATGAGGSVSDIRRPSAHHDWQYWGIRIGKYLFQLGGHKTE